MNVGYVFKRNQPEIIEEIHSFLTDNYSSHEMILDESCRKGRNLNINLIRLLDSKSEILNLVVYDAFHFSSSSLQCLFLLDTLLEKRISVTFIKYDIKIKPKLNMDKKIMLNLCGKIKQDFILNKVRKKKKSEQAINKEDNLVPQSYRRLKLDRYQSDIEKYLNVGIDCEKISKIIGCHPKTLRKYVSLRMPNRIDFQ